MATLAVITKRGAVFGRYVPRSVATVCAQRRDKSDISLVNYKRGKGGRSSFSGLVATVFGGNGQLGRSVISRLGNIGSQIIVPYRSEPIHILPLRLSGDLGQILFFPFDLKDDESIRTAMKHSNVVINCIGNEHETMNFSFNDVHVDGPQRIARIAKEMGVSKFVHLSALNASLIPQQIYIPGGSEYYKSKKRGEEAVRSEFPEAIIFRPADMFGSRDRFVHYYANGRRLWFSNQLPLWKKGEQTIKQPVFVSDVVTGIMNAIRDDEAEGKTFEAFGPCRHKLSDIVTFMYGCMRRDLKITEMTSSYLFFPKYEIPFMKRMPINLPRIEREFVTDYPTDCPTLEDLGVPLTRLVDRMKFEIRPYVVVNEIEEMKGEFGVPTHLPTVDRFV